ncbi:MAG: DUF3987 domain-containing protein [Waterburya sp.]
MEITNKPKSVTKSEPCPHCQKTDWCYQLGDLSVCNRDFPPATGWKVTNKQDANGHCYYAPIGNQPMKTEKPTVIDVKTWYYNDRDGNKLVAVERQFLSDGDKKIAQKAWTGKTWAWTTKHIPRENIPIFRYPEVKAAIAKGETIFWVEGEKCVEALESLGLVATTNCGGSKRFSVSDMEDLKGAKLVICPDGDKYGLELANKVAEYFPDAKWLYAYPESKNWKHIPESKGFDVADWIYGKKLTASDVKKSVEKRRLIDFQDQKLDEIGFSKNDKKRLEEVRASVDRLIYSQLSEADREIWLINTSSLYGMHPDKLKSYYYSRLKELEEEASRDDRQKEIDKALDSLNEDLPLDGFFPDEIVKPLRSFATQMKYKEVSLVTAILTATSVLHKVGTRLKISEGFYISPNIFSFLVSHSGQGKSPLIKTIIENAFRLIENDYNAQYNRKVTEYENALEEWKSIDSKERRELGYTKPIEPPSSPRILFATDMNGTAVNQQFSRYPDAGFLGIYDEGKKLLNFNGRGRTADDESDLLSFYDGSGVKELRTEKGVRTNVPSTLLGVYAGIQPTDLLELMGQCEDSRGKWARFLFTIEHKERRWFEFYYEEEQEKVIEIWDILAKYYRRFLSAEKTIYRLTEQGQKAIQDYLNYAVEPERMKVSESILETFLNKAGSRIAKLATNLHLWSTEEAHKQAVIEEETVYKALVLDEFYTKQIDLLYSKSKATRGDLEPLLAEIMTIAYKMGFSTDALGISAKDVARNSWVFRKQKTSMDEIRQHFKRLEDFGYGKCNPDFGIHMRFIPNKR